MVRKLRDDAAVLIQAVLRQDAGRELEGGKTVQVQFASACGKVIATVPGTISSVPPRLTLPHHKAAPREVQIVVSREALRSVSGDFATPVAHLPQTPSAFLGSDGVVLGTIWSDQPQLPLLEINENSTRQE